MRRGERAPRAASAHARQTQTGRAARAARPVPFGVTAALRATAACGAGPASRRTHLGGRALRAVEPARTPSPGDRPRGMNKGGHAQKRSGSIPLTDGGRARAAPAPRDAAPADGRPRRPPEAGDAHGGPACESPHRPTPRACRGPAVDHTVGPRAARGPAPQSVIRSGSRPPRSCRPWTWSTGRSACAGRLRPACHRRGPGLARRYGPSPRHTSAYGERNAVARCASDRCAATA